MIIALESASTDPSLALASPDGVSFAVDGWAGERRQAGELLPHLIALLARSGRELHEASAVVVGIGPGSFTGLRVSMSIAKGIALALGIPIAGVPSLDAWLVAEPDATAAVTRAGASEAFVQLRGEPEPRVLTAEQVVALLARSSVVVAGELAADFGIGNARPPDRAAAAVAEMGAARLARTPGGDDLERLEPSYLRGPRGLAAPASEGAAWP